MPRDQWPPSALRALWEPLRDLAEQRLKSPRHESRWFNLAGLLACGPGTGFPLDEVRIKALWPVFHQGVQARQGRAVLGRVVDPLAAGRGRAVAAHHEEIYRRLVPVPAARQGRPARQEGGPAQARAARAGRDVAVRRQPGAARRPSSRSRWATSLVKDLARPILAGHVLWCLGRLGARVPLYGPANTAVPARPPSAGSRPCSTATSPRPRDDRRHLRPRRNSPASRATAPATSTTPSGPGSSTGLPSSAPTRPTLRPVREFTELETAQQGQALGDACRSASGSQDARAGRGDCRLSDFDGIESEDVLGLAAPCSARSDHEATLPDESDLGIAPDEVLDRADASTPRCRRRRTARP